MNISDEEPIFYENECFFNWSSNVPVASFISGPFRIITAVAMIAYGVLGYAFVMPFSTLGDKLIQKDYNCLFADPPNIVRIFTGELLQGILDLIPGTCILRRCCGVRTKDVLNSLPSKALAYLIIAAVSPIFGVFSLILNVPGFVIAKIELSCFKSYFRVLEERLRKNLEDERLHRSEYKNLKANYYTTKDLANLRKLRSDLSHRNRLCCDICRWAQKILMVEERDHVKTNKTIFALRCCLALPDSEIFHRLDFRRPSKFQWPPASLEEFDVDRAKLLEKKIKQTEENIAQYYMIKKFQNVAQKSIGLKDVRIHAVEAKLHAFLDIPYDRKNPYKAIVEK